MHIHNSCTRNGDNLNLLNKTGNAHEKECCHKRPIILLKNEGGGIETQSKMIMAAEWWMFSQLQK